MGNENEPDPLLGKTLNGRYQIAEVVGKGGMGVVYLAHILGASGFRRRVAIKRMLPDFSHVAHIFIEEARLMEGLSHPNIASILSFEVEEPRVAGQPDRYFMVIEYIEGVRVYDLIEQQLADGSVQHRPLPLPVVLYIAEQLLRALQHFAEVTVRGKRAELVHRDPTLVNIICGFGGEVKVIDFGIARAEVDFRNRTQAPGYKGNPYYSAPEQANGIPVEHRTDVFIAGVDIYEMLRGDRAFPGTQAQAIQVIRLGGVPAPLPADTPAPPELIALLRRMMNIDIAARPTAKECRAELRNIVSKLERDTGQPMLLEVGRDMLIGLVSAMKRGKLRGTSPNLGAEAVQAFVDALPPQARNGIIRQPSVPSELPATVRAISPPHDSPVVRAHAALPLLSDDASAPNQTLRLPDGDPTTEKLDENVKPHTRRTRSRGDGGSKGRFVIITAASLVALGLAATLAVAKFQRSPAASANVEAAREPVTPSPVVATAPEPPAAAPKPAIQPSPAMATAPMAPATANFELQSANTSAGRHHHSRAKMADGSHASTDEAPPMPSAPVATPQQPAGPTIDELATEAQNDYVHSAYHQAVETAKRVLSDPRATEVHRAKVLRVLGAANCFLKNATGAREAYSKVAPQEQSFLQYVCGRNGVTLP